MSLVFQTIDPPSPSPPGECVPPAFVGGGGRTHSPGGEGGGWSIVWKTRDIGLLSYRNNLSTGSGFSKNLDFERFRDLIANILLVQEGYGILFWPYLW
jgi:hypothetical protein